MVLSLKVYIQSYITNMYTESKVEFAISRIQQFFELLFCLFLIDADNPSRKTVLLLSLLKSLLIVSFEVSELTVSE